MTKVQFAIPGDIGTPTGGYVYDRQVMALLPRFGVDVAHLPLPGGFPAPTADRDWRRPGGGWRPFRRIASC